MPLLGRSVGGECLESERKHLTHCGPVQARLIVCLHVLVRDAQEVLEKCGVCRDMEENKGLPSADVPVPNTTDHSSDKSGGMKLKRIAFLINDISGQICLM